MVTSSARAAQVQKRLSAKELIAAAIAQKEAHKAGKRIEARCLSRVLREHAVSERTFEALRLHERGFQP
jgi:hypothetical protein